MMQNEHFDLNDIQHEPTEQNKPFSIESEYEFFAMKYLALAVQCIARFRMTVDL